MNCLRRCVFFDSFQTFNSQSLISFVKSHSIAILYLIHYLFIHIRQRQSLQVDLLKFQPVAELGQMLKMSIPYFTLFKASSQILKI